MPRCRRLVLPAATLLEAAPLARWQRCPLGGAATPQPPHSRAAGSQLTAALASAPLSRPRGPSGRAPPASAQRGGANT
eukprot:1310863-Pyramimonas_sp.AAC.1